MPQDLELKATMDIQDIMRILPQRYPFLMIDKVLDYLPSTHANGVTGRVLRAMKNVTINEPFFPGHFPGQPVMPGVMQIEAMAQACAIACWNPDNAGKKMVIAGVDKARFRRPVVPGDTLVFDVLVSKYKSSLAVIECKASVDGQVASEASLLASVFR